MKTLKIIIFAAIALLGLTSCSDEQKALNFVSKEVVTENNLDDFLIRYKIQLIKEDFQNNCLRYYLNSRMNKGSRYVYLWDEFAHFRYNCRSDMWLSLGAESNVDSDVILNTIVQLILERLDVILNDTINYNEFVSTNWSKEKLFNYILSKSTLKMFHDEEEMKQLGLDVHNYEHRRIYEYDWLILGMQNQQAAFIDEIVNWIVSSSRDEVMSKQYRLVDKQCTTVGENQFEVEYLLEPKSEIHFDVSKVGETFVLHSTRVY